MQNDPLLSYTTFCSLRVPKGCMHNIYYFTFKYAFTSGQEQSRMLKGSEFAAFSRWLWFFRLPLKWASKWCNLF